MYNAQRGHRRSSQNPFTEHGERHWTIAAIVASVVAAGVSTYAAVQQSEAQAEATKAAKQQREVEAQIAGDNAAFEEQQHRRKMLLLLGKQHAIQSAYGVVSDVGTPLQNEIDTVKQGELEALRIRAQGTNAAGERLFESKMAGFQARSIRAQIPLQIASGITSAAAGAISAYSSYKKSTIKQQQPSVVNNLYYGQHVGQYYGP